LGVGGNISVAEGLSASTCASASLGRLIAIGWIFGSNAWHIGSYETLEDSDY